LGDALIDDVAADLRQAVDIRFARPEIATFDGVVEQPINTVAVVLVVLGGVNAALGGDAVGTARAVLETKALHLVTEFPEARGSRGSGQSAAHHDNVELALVRRVDQFQIEFVLVPFLGQRTGRYFGIKRHITSAPPFPKPSKIATGMEE
jgi:hypothetical protein